MINLSKPVYRELPDTLIGQIVLISIPSHIPSLSTSDTVYQVAFRVTDITHFLYGDFLAGSYNASHNRVKICYISDYEILTLKDLPLLIGYEYTTDLLAELIKG